MKASSRLSVSLSHTPPLPHTDGGCGFGRCAFSAPPQTHCPQISRHRGEELALQTNFFGTESETLSASMILIPGASQPSATFQGNIPRKEWQ